MDGKVNQAINIGAAIGAFAKSVGKVLLEEAATELAVQGVVAVTTGGSGNAIRITERGMAHVIARHTAEGAENAGKSIFNAGENLVDLVRAGDNMAATLQSFGRNSERVIDAGRIIGTNRATGQATSIYTIITNPSNSLVTMFPGTP